MARLTPAFSTNRTVRQYTEEHYLPAAALYRQRCAERGKVASDLLAWTRELDRHWAAIRFGTLDVETQGSQFVFAVQVYLDELDPDAVNVELFADTKDGVFRQKMDRGQPLVGSMNSYLYSVRVPADRPAKEYTPRIVANRPEAVVPLEANQILWQC